MVEAQEWRTSCCEKKETMEREERSWKLRTLHQASKFMSRLKWIRWTPVTDNHLAFALDVVCTPTITGCDGDDDSESIHLGADDVFRRTIGDVKR